jgi:hypothetical protein
MVFIGVIDVLSVTSENFGGSLWFPTLSAEKSGKDGARDVGGECRHRKMQVFHCAALGSG